MSLVPYCTTRCIPYISALMHMIIQTHIKQIISFVYVRHIVLIWSPRKAVTMDNTLNISWLFRTLPKVENQPWTSAPEQVWLVWQKLASSPGSQCIHRDLYRVSQFPFERERRKSWYWFEEWETFTVHKRLQSFNSFTYHCYHLLANVVPNNRMLHQSHNHFDLDQRYLDTRVSQWLWIVLHLDGYGWCVMHHSS